MALAGLVGFCDGALSPALAWGAISTDLVTMVAAAAAAAAAAATAATAAVAEDEIGRYLTRDQIARRGVRRERNKADARGEARESPAKDATAPLSIHI